MPIISKDAITKALRRTPSDRASSMSSNSSDDGNLTLAERNYPHLHVTELTYSSCQHIPKHSVERSIQGCTCGKKVVERYRSLEEIRDGECAGCVSEMNDL